MKLSDAMLAPAECAAALGGLDWLVLVLAGLFWIFRLFKFLCHLVQFWDIKLFFNTALKIEDVSTSKMISVLFPIPNICIYFFQSDLDNLTWHEVQKKIREVQSEIQMSINKEQLTELDIYHRILRYVRVDSSRFTADRNSFTNLF